MIECTSISRYPLDMVTAMFPFFSVFQQLRVLLELSQGLKKTDEFSFEPGDFKSCFVQKQLDEKCWQQHFNHYFPDATKGSNELYFDAFFRKANEYISQLQAHIWLFADSNKYLKADKEVVLFVVSKMGTMLQFASELLKDDEDIVEQAVRQDGFALEYASARLQAVKHLALTAVGQNGRALKHVASFLKLDPELVVNAIKQCPAALAFADQKLQKDPKLQKLASFSNAEQRMKACDDYLCQLKNLKHHCGYQSFFMKRTQSPIYTKPQLEENMIEVSCC